MASRHRSTKGEGRDLESLIAEFAREIQVLGAPKAVQDGNGKSLAGEEPQKSHTSSSVVDKEPAPPKIELSDRPDVPQSAKAAAVPESPTFQSTSRRDRQRQTGSTPSPSVTRPAQKVSVDKIATPDPGVEKDLKPANAELREEPPVQKPASIRSIPAPVGRQSTKYPPVQADKNHVHTGSTNQHSEKLRNTRSDSWKSMHANAGISASANSQVQLVAALLAISVALVLGWLVALGFFSLA
jgi:hypothetical protein